METIVAVEVQLENGERRYFLTWGRIQNTIDPKPLEDLILKKSSHFAIGGKAISARLCASLQEASNEPGFYVCFFEMCQMKIPYGKTTYPKWRSKINKLMRNGKEIAFLWHG
jgi:hypothetical protein